MYFSFCHSWVGLDSGCGAVLRQAEHVRESGVGEGQGRGIGNSRRHICDAVVDHSIDQERGVAVGGGVGGFNATALVDGDIDHDGSFLHSGDHLPGHNPGS